MLGRIKSGLWALAATAFLCFLSQSPLAAQAPWSLDRAIEHAQRENLSIAQSELALNLGGLDISDAKGARLPSLNASTSHGYNWGQRVDPFTNTFASERIRSNSLSLGSNVSLYNGRSAQLGIDRAEEAFIGAREDLEAARNNVAMQVASAFLGVLFSQDQLEIARSNKASTAEQVERVLRLVNAGAAAEGDLLDIRAQLAGDQSNIVSAQGQFDIARLGLAQVLRLEGSAAESITVERPDLSLFRGAVEMPRREILLASALESFPEIKSAESGVRTSEIDHALAKSQAQPSLSASWSYGTGFSGAAKDPVGDPSLEIYPIGYLPSTEELVMTVAQTYSEYSVRPFTNQFEENLNQSVFFSLSIPIFNGHRVRNGVKRAEISMDRAELALESTRQILTQSVEAAHSDARISREAWMASEDAHNAAQRAFEYAELRYEQGASNQVDFTQARNRRDNAKMEALRKQYDMIFKLAILDYYGGRSIRLDRAIGQ
jgi:outer membrane protein